ncbi:MAG: DUF3050 domain-containing protein [Gemmataceae bacterium]
MSLLKALQACLCCVGVPWLPAADPQATRFINEIVLAEESDEDGQGGYLSHFGLYLRAMTRCGADAGTIDGFLGEIRKGNSVPAALAAVGVAGSVGRFVRQTLRPDRAGEPLVLGLGVHVRQGRPAASPVPADRGRVERGGGRRAGGLPLLPRRHIGLDEGEHGPMAVRLVLSLCGNDEARWQDAEEAAVTALEARRDLWDAVHATLRRRKDASGRSS